MAQTWRMSRRFPADAARAARPPLDPEALHRLAITYVGRYATTRAKLGAYLSRKLGERGWEGEGPDVGALVERFAALGYVDDLGFATARAVVLQRRGFGERRIDLAMRVAGIEADDADAAKVPIAGGGFAAALVFARRRRIGPFAVAEPDRPARQRALAAMLRGGHSFEISRKIVYAPIGTVPEEDA